MQYFSRDLVCSLNYKDLNSALAAFPLMFKLLVFLVQLQVSDILP